METPSQTLHPYDETGPTALQGWLYLAPAVAGYCLTTPHANPSVTDALILLNIGALYAQLWLDKVMMHFDKKTLQIATETQLLTGLTAYLYPVHAWYTFYLATILGALWGLARLSSAGYDTKQFLLHYMTYFILIIPYAYLTYQIKQAQ
jgi:L-lactate permease